MSNKTKVNSNAIFNALKSVFGILYPLITFPYISRVLMAENVGKINFASSIVSYFSLIASLGVTTYAVRECSRVKRNQDELSKIASQILSINIMSMLIAYIALIITLVAAKPLEHYRILICIQSFSILFTTIGADWLNTAMEDFRFIAIRTMGMQVFSLILMFALVNSPKDYLRYAGISVIASSGANLINIFYRRRFCKVRFTFKMDIKKHFPSIMMLFSLILSQTIYCNSDMTMLGLMKGDYEVGLYSVSVKIYNIINTVVASVAWVVMPQLSVGFKKKDYKEVNRLLKYSLNFIIVLGLPCLVGLNVIAKELVYVLAGQEYLRATSSLHILSISLAFSFISGWIGNMMMLPAGREKICLKSSVLAAVANVVLNLFLIPSIGSVGAAITTAVSELIGIIYKYPFIDKNIQFKGFNKMIKAPLAGAIGIGGIGIVVKSMLKSEFIIVCVTMVLSVIMYFGILYFFKNEFFLELIEPIRNRFNRRE